MNNRAELLKYLIDRQKNWLPNYFGIIRIVIKAMDQSNHVTKL